MHDTQSQISIPVHCGDSGRKLFITLSEGGKPYEIGEGCYAYINARTHANTTQSLMCNIANNTIEFDFSENNDAVNMIAVVGLTHCDVTLFDADGYIVTAPRFTFVVIDQISNPRNVELSSDDVSLLSNWETIFAGWARAENTRHDNEEVRKSQESIRQDNENERKGHELSRIANEFARNSAETERQQTYEEAKESLTSVIAKANEAKESAESASASASEAKSDANRAEEYGNQAVLYAGQIGIARDEVMILEGSASVYASNAKKSETNAKASEENAKRIADEVRSAAEATPAYLDYLAHYNCRVQQLTANIGESNKFPNATGRGIGMIPLNVNAVVREDFEGGQYMDYGFIIMHPKAIGSFSINAGAGECGCLLVSKGITSLTVGSGVRTIDLSLLTGNMTFPSLSVTDSTIGQVTVQKGRKSELQSMTNWSDCNIVEVETW